MADLGCDVVAGPELGTRSDLPPHGRKNNPRNERRSVAKLKGFMNIGRISKC